MNEIEKIFEENNKVLLLETHGLLYDKHFDSKVVKSLNRPFFVIDGSMNDLIYKIKRNFSCILAKRLVDEVGKPELFDEAVLFIQNKFNE